VQKFKRATGIVITILLAALFIPMIIISMSLIIESSINKNDTPEILGYIPMSAENDCDVVEITSGDLVICKSVEEEEITKGCVIAFYGDDQNEVVLRQVVDINNEGDTPIYTTTQTDSAKTYQGVAYNDVIGVYVCDFRNMGGLVNFLHTVEGLITCIMIPICWIALCYMYRLVSGNLEKIKTNTPQSQDINAKS
jgi:hypothetical protein